MHDRYDIAEDNIGLVTVAGVTGIVADLSYGGLQAKFDPSTSGNVNFEGPMKAVVQFFDRSCVGTAKAVRTVYQQGNLLLAGFQFLHDRPEALLFLREFIEPLRCGGTLEEITGDKVAAKFQGEEWRCYRGDGPTDLILRLSPDRTKLLDGHMIFRDGEDYCEVIYKDGSLRTGRSAGAADENHDNPQGLAGVMQPTPKPDSDILRYAATILLGTAGSLRKMVAPIFESATERLHSNTPTEAPFTAKTGT